MRIIYASEERIKKNNKRVERGIAITILSWIKKRSSRRERGGYRQGYIDIEENRKDNREHVEKDVRC